MTPLFWKNTKQWDLLPYIPHAWDDWDTLHTQDSYLQEDEVWQLSLDVLENKESLYILAPLAWIKLEDIDISIQETTLIISWIRNKPKEFFDYGIEVRNEECFWGRFSRKIILPENIDFSSVKAIMEQNLLVISLPKIRFSWQQIRIETPHI